jgi:hypothetical protein
VNGGIEYKVWLDGKAVDAQFYTMIETVTVEQGIDLATEARIDLEMCVDKYGKWTGPGAAYAKTWQRMRIEVRNQKAAWVPLIDGPVVTWNAGMSGEPGQSIFTLVARDDTQVLNLVAQNETFEDQTDEEVIRAMFDRAGDVIERLDIDAPPEQPDDRPLKHIKRGTEMDMLRSIADPYDLHVYVMPGKIGKSIGYVKRLATKNTSNLPVLQLAGPDRNVENFHASNDVAKATRYQGLQLDINDVSFDTAVVSKWTDDDDSTGDDTAVGDPVALLGNEPAIDSLDKLGTEILSPYISAFRDVEELVQRWQQRSSYTITATGVVRYGCYDGVLRAYDIVGVTGVSERLCTNFLVREVTHTLSRSEYRQEFTLMTNATAKVQQSGSDAVPSSII